MCRPTATWTSSWRSTPGPRGRWATGTHSRPRRWTLLRSEATPAEDASIVRIWPEHFDAAIDAGDPARNQRGTYGASPGDRHHAEPYLYASPWAGRISDFFGDPTFKGASVLYDELLAAPDPMAAAVAFLRDARDRIRRFD